MPTFWLNLLIKLWITSDNNKLMRFLVNKDDHRLVTGRFEWIGGFVTKRSFSGESLRWGLVDDDCTSGTIFNSPSLLISLAERTACGSFQIRFRFILKSFQDHLKAFHEHFKSTFLKRISFRRITSESKSKLEANTMLGNICETRWMLWIWNTNWNRRNKQTERQSSQKTLQTVRRIAEKSQRKRLATIHEVHDEVFGRNSLSEWDLGNI